MQLVSEPILECVPNFSEGRRKEVIDAITAEIESVPDVYLLHVDMGWSTNRTVVTFAGKPEAVVEAAFRAIKKAAELIDMRTHSGAHPRMGATDVCPLVPVSGISMEEAVELSYRLAERVGTELQIPVYLYENSARAPERKSLANIRAGEYEALPAKLRDPKWKPDYGPAEWNEHVAKTGATVIGARNFLVAYNINLNTRSVRRANSVAFDLRERGRVLRRGHPVVGEIIRDIEGNPYRLPGQFKDVRGIGWYIDEYGIAQVSLNILNIDTCPVHLVFEQAEESARKRGLRVTGSEIVGLVPLRVLLEAGKYFLRKQKLSWGVPPEELIHIAVVSMGLSEVQPFDPQKKVIEFILAEKAGKQDIYRKKSVREFVNEVSMDSPVPGGGSVSALAGSLAAALTAMVANITANRRGGEEDLPFYASLAEQAQKIKDELYVLMQQDQEAFEKVMEAYKTKDENEIEKALLEAARTPLKVLETIAELVDVINEVALKGLGSAISDVGVAANLMVAAARGANLNVLINIKDMKDETTKARLQKRAEELLQRIEKSASEVLKIVEKRMFQGG